MDGHMLGYLHDGPSNNKTPKGHILLEEQYLLCSKLSDISLLWCLAFWNVMFCCLLLFSLAGVPSRHAQLVLCASELISSVPTQVSAFLQA